MPSHIGERFRKDVTSQSHMEVHMLRSVPFVMARRQAKVTARMHEGNITCMLKQNSSDNAPSPDTQADTHTHTPSLVMQ